MTQVNRIPDKGLINRKKIIKFLFDGKEYYGYEGDTLASAMLANGIKIVGRSFKYHRPRGIYADGVEEPNALVQLEKNGDTVPNVQATQVELYDGLLCESQNRWPNLKFDLLSILNLFGRLLPAGFYNKTFMWPAGFWRYYEHLIRKAAGRGSAPEQADHDHYDQVNIHTDIMVVGGGPAGITAAYAAAQGNCRVILVEQTPWLGGRYVVEAGAVKDQKTEDWIDNIRVELSKLENVTILTRTTAFGYYDNNLVYCNERLLDHLPCEHREGLPRQRLWRVRAKQIILACGALERPLVFKNNDRPGIVLASSVNTCINRFGVMPGRRAIVYTNNDSAYSAIEAFINNGGKIIAVLDTRKEVPKEIVEKIDVLGVRLITNAIITDVHGKKSIKGVTIQQLSKEGDEPGKNKQRLSCDLLACSGGWNPTVHIYSQAGGSLCFDQNIAGFVPKEKSLQTLSCVGALAGIYDLNQCLQDGLETGINIAAQLGYKSSISFKPPIQKSSYVAQQLGPLFAPVLRLSDQRKQFVDLQNDVTVADIKLALREGFDSVELVKRYTTSGMGPDQGKTANINVLEIISKTLGNDYSNCSTTTFRPPYTPVTFGSLAGSRRNEFIVPLRRMPIQGSHERQGAIFENAGLWRRPIYYPRLGENAQEAALREARCVRQNVGIMEVSPFGKIEIKGRDALLFINRLYTNSFTSLEIGRCRYGVILNEYGTIFEDGLVVRLGEDHFLLSTTSGHAQMMVPWLEYQLQVEWPELEVYLTDVMEQWAQIVVAGPQSRDLLSKVTDIGLGKEEFPHLTMKNASVSGVPARVFRVSFTGDLAYEVAVPSGKGEYVWEQLLSAGKELGVMPYGLIASNILRMEKGYILVGEDTEGVQTPGDMGMDWVISKKKKEEFIGGRSLSLATFQKTGRKQFVGLLTEDPNYIIPIGAPAVESVHADGKNSVCGHVTASQYSVAMNRSMALALIRDGRNRMDEVVNFDVEGRTVKAKIVEPCFFDIKGEKLHA